MRKYNALLTEYIKTSGLTLREITARCAKRGRRIAPSYVSKLQNGHLPPPSEEVSVILAEVLGCDPDILVYYGYIEKAPETIRQILPTNYNEVPVNILTLIERISNLPPKFREKICYEVEWLERLAAHHSQPPVLLPELE